MLPAIDSVQKIKAALKLSARALHNKHVKESKLLISVIPWLPEVAGLNIALLFPLFPPETFHPIPDSERAGVSLSKSLAAPAPQLV